MELSSRFVLFNGEAETAAATAPREMLLIAAVASALSMISTGFLFGIDNNVFHLPIVAGLYDEPQFHDDAFIQSLRHFASGIWLLLSRFDTYLGHTQGLFLGLAYLSRLLSFIGLLCCASLVGIVGTRDRMVFSLLICITTILTGGSYGGLGGLFLNYFTHSEIANGTMLLAIYFAAKGRFTAATILVGATFFINAFMAVWLVVLLGFVAICLLARGDIPLGKACSQVLIGALPAALLAAPVIIGIVSNPEFGPPLDFDYTLFLHQYFAGHSLIDAIPAGNLFALAALTLLGAIALYLLGPTARALQAAYGGAVVLYLTGAVLPLVTESPNLLNLHLLRSSVMFHLLAGLAIAALVTRWLRDTSRPAFLLGGIVALLLSASETAILVCIPVLLVAPRVLAARRPLAPSLRALGYLLLAYGALIAGPLSAGQAFTENRPLANAIAEWDAVGRWARSATPAAAIFLVPTRLHDTPEPTPAHMALMRPEIFEFAAHRRVWVDFKRGAAAMWMPSYYHLWRTRMNEVNPLTSLDQRRTYARDHGISYVIDHCDTAPAAAEAIYHTAQLCVFPADAPQAAR